MLLLVGPQDLHTRHGLTFMQVCGGILTLKEAKYECIFSKEVKMC